MALIRLTIWGLKGAKTPLASLTFLLLMQVEDAKEFIKSRILSLIDMEQTPHKVGAAKAL